MHAAACERVPDRLQQRLETLWIEREVVEMDAAERKRLRAERRAMSAEDVREQENKEKRRRDEELRLALREEQLHESIERNRMGACDDRANAPRLCSADAEAVTERASRAAGRHQQAT